MNKIFAGHAGVLILTESGMLYGVGNNDTGSFGKEKKGEILPVPQLIADNIKSAAAGYNYSMCLTANGEVKLIGNSGIPYINRFPGFQNVTNVFASPERDVFWVLMKNGDLYVWGDNAGGIIIPSTSKVLHDFNKFEIEVEYMDSLIRRKEGSSYGPMYNIVGSKCDYSCQQQQLENIEIRIKQTDLYQRYASDYGENNLRISFNLVNKQISREEAQNRNIPSIEYGQTYNEDTLRVQKETYQPQIIYENRYIFEPVLASETSKYLPGMYYYGSGLASINLQIDKKTVKKVACFKANNISYYAVLKGDFTLQILQNNQPVFFVSGVADISITNHDAYILTRDNQLLKGRTENLVKENELHAYTYIQLP